MSVINISKLKDCKYLKSDDLKKILPDSLIISCDKGAVIKLNNDVYIAKTYKFDTIEGIQKEFFGKDLFVYDFDSGFKFPKNEIYLTNDDTILFYQKNTIQQGFKVDCNCKINIEFISDNINDCCSCFVIRLYEKEIIDGDTFKECNSITECIIKTVEENISKIN